MSSMLTSHGLVFATAMAVSAGTIILFDLFKDKYFPPSPHIPPNHDSAPPQRLKSCLSSGKKRVKAEKNVNDKEKKMKMKMKKKRVHFADDVRETKGNGELYRREHQRKFAEIHHKAKSCANEILDLNKMPPNRAALYSGILRDRVQRMGYSY